MKDQCSYIERYEDNLVSAQRLIIMLRDRSRMALPDKGDVIYVKRSANVASAEPAMNDQKRQDTSASDKIKGEFVVGRKWTVFQMIGYGIGTVCVATIQAWLWATIFRGLHHHPELTSMLRDMVAALLSIGIFLLIDWALKWELFTRTCSGICIILIFVIEFHVVENGYRLITGKHPGGYLVSRLEIVLIVQFGLLTSHYFWASCVGDGRKLECILALFACGRIALMHLQRRMR